VTTAIDHVSVDAEPATPTWTLERYEYEYALDRIAGLAKKAARAGVALPELRIVREWTAEEGGLSGDEPAGWILPARTVHYVEVEAEGFPFRTQGNGWEVLGVIEHAEVGNLLHGDLDPAEWADARPVCQHCSTNRRRAKTVALAREGERIQVGATCLKDFLGHNLSLPALDGLREEMDEIGRLGGARRDWATLDAIRSAIRLVRTYGYVKTFDGTASQPSTANALREIAQGSGLGRKIAREVADRNYNADEIADEADKILAWVTGLPGETSYEHNLKTACGSPYATDRHLGVVVSAVPAYRRAMDAEAEREAKAAAEPEAAPIPEELLSGRHRILGTVLSAHAKDTDYGTRYVMTVLDDRGFKVWGTDPFADGIDRGERVVFWATIERSDTDPTFGFFKRPTKAGIYTTDEEAAALRGEVQA